MKFGFLVQFMTYPWERTAHSTVINFTRSWSGNSKNGMQYTYVRAAQPVARGEGFVLEDIWNEKTSFHAFPDTDDAEHRSRFKILWAVYVWRHILPYKSISYKCAKK